MSSVNLLNGVSVYSCFSHQRKCTSGPSIKSSIAVQKYLSARRLIYTIQMQLVWGSNPRHLKLHLTDEVPFLHVLFTFPDTFVVFDEFFVCSTPIQVLSAAHSITLQKSGFEISVQSSILWRELLNTNRMNILSRLFIQWIKGGTFYADWNYGA